MVSKGHQQDKRRTCLAVVFCPQGTPSELTHLSLTISVSLSVCLSNRKRVKSTLPQKFQPAAPQVSATARFLCCSHRFIHRGVFSFTRPAQEAVGTNQHHERQQISRHWQVYVSTRSFHHHTAAGKTPILCNTPVKG